MNYFLFKSDPDTYSLQDLKKDKKTVWDGVHNFQAIGNIKKIKPGDKVYIYHSQTDKSIVGLAKAVSEPYENRKDPRKSWVVEIEFVKEFKTPVTLDDFKKQERFKDFLLLRNGRLSVMEVPAAIQKWIDSKV